MRALHKVYIFSKLIQWSLTGSGGWVGRIRNSLGSGLEYLVASLGCVEG